MKAKPKAKRVVVKSSDLQRSDDVAREKELAAYAADRSLKMPVLLSLRAPGVRLKWPGRIR
ncbi:MAG: hypothetical protein IPG63_12675 [Xanthomonadales bacterium]|nr:hypothetical protein [Xanthomonadales bacterium]MBK7145239.1 hypothetical protein [Xanthomonadales bacterium]MCC6560359.1 hypothetical protein [Xanthomonadales bacterium]